MRMSRHRLKALFIALRRLRAQPRRLRPLLLWFLLCGYVAALISIGYYSAPPILALVAGYLILFGLLAFVAWWVAQRESAVTLVDAAEDSDGAPDSLLPPVSAQIAARRCLCSASLASRAQLELELQTSTSQVVARLTDPERLALRGWLLSQLRKNDLWEDLHPKERNALSQPLGSWSSAQIDQSVAYGSSASALLWVLKRQPMPPYDVPDFPWPAPKTAELLLQAPDFIARAEIREIPEVRVERDLARLWYSRAYSELVRRNPGVASGFGHPGLSDDELREVTKAGAGMGFFEPIGGDFPVVDRAYRSVTDMEAQILFLCILERCRTLDWVMGDLSFEAYPALTSS